MGSKWTPTCLMVYKAPNNKAPTQVTDIYSYTQGNMRKLIKKILKEDFGWIDNIPASVVPDDLEIGKVYTITWNNNQWLGAFRDDFHSGDRFVLTSIMGSRYYFVHVGTNFYLKVPIDPKDSDEFWRPQNYGINVK